MPTTTITTEARRLCRQHNNDEGLVSGYIYLVDLRTGEIGELVAGYACEQIAEGHKLYGRYAVMRVGHGRITQKQAQGFIDSKGKGW